MTNRTALLFVLAIATSIASHAQTADQVGQVDQAAAPPAADAPGAIEVASKFMTLVFDRKMTEARVVGVHGDWADVETRPFQQTTCMLRMHREPITNAEGWVVQTYTCTKHKTSTQ